MAIEGGVAAELEAVLYDPQTSGGLLFAASRARSIVSSQRWRPPVFTPPESDGSAQARAGIQIVVQA